MKLKSMKIDKAAQKKKYSEASVAIDAPSYPYGLELRLDKDALKKLGLTDNLPKVGTSLKLEALVDVTSVSEHESSRGTDCSLSIQITDMGLSAAKDDDAGDALYSDAKGSK